MRIDAKGMHYRTLNEIIKGAVDQGVTEIEIVNVNGQRYIGTGIDKPVTLHIHGVPGSDLAAFTDGPTIHVYANGEELIGNTMNSGKIVIHGHASDVTGFAMRGGKIYVRDSVGYRVGIHMKAFNDSVPVLVIGGAAGDFLGEYMAGGILILLGLEREPGQPVAGDYIGAGMHGGVIYIRGSVEEYQLGKEVSVLPVDEEDMALVKEHLTDFCREFKLDMGEILQEKFIKVMPLSHRPYGQLYVSY